MHSLSIDCLSRFPIYISLSCSFFSFKDWWKLIASSTDSLSVVIVISLYRRTPEHLRSHLVTKHDISCSAEELESILQSYSMMSLKDVTDFVKYIDTLPEPIVGLPIMEEGYC